MGAEIYEFECFDQLINTIPTPAALAP